MSFVGSNILAGASGQGGGGYEIERSLRFNSGDSAYLNRTFSAGNRKTWTWSGWIKRNKLGTTQRIFAVGGGPANNDNWFAIAFNTSNQIFLGGYSIFFRTSTAVYRDVSAWMHCVVSVDLTASTTMKVWINGVEQSLSGSSDPSDTGINNNLTHYLGVEGASAYCDLQLAEVHFIDGQALAPTNFGETDDNGVWQPIEYAGTYGTNGFHLDFKDNSSKDALGTDTSGNSNTWTVNNIAASAPGLATANQGMDVVTYTGNAGTKVVSGLAFQPDLLWLKRRDGAAHHYLVDSVRGLGSSERLASDMTDAAGDGTQRVASFNSDGFTVSGNYGYTNISGGNYVAFAWKAGGAASSNTDGTITSSVSANTTYGFSIVSYTGNNTSGATVGHGLGSAVKFLIVKSRNQAQYWHVWHSSLANNEYIYLNASNAKTSGNDFLNGTAPGSSTFTLGSGNACNKSSDPVIAYVWSEVAGFSKFSSYTGSGSANKVVTGLGFKPRYLLIKRADGSIENWQVVDSERGTNAQLHPDLNDAEATTASRNISFQDNGFTIIGTNAGINGSGYTYIYAAFAAKPDESVIDSLVDSPSQTATPTDTGAGGEVVGNYATLNPLDSPISNSGSLTNGNLNLNGASTWSANRATIAYPSSGKWYYEVQVNGSAASRGSNSQYSVVGICKTSDYFTGSNITSNMLWLGDNGYGRNFFYTGTTDIFGANIDGGKIIGLAVDIDNNTFEYFVDGVSKQTGTINVTSGTPLSPLIASYGNSQTSLIANFGQRAFANTNVPSGYKSLNTANLPEPTIADGSKYFNTKLYTGNQSVRSIPTSFSPDFVWIKDRTDTNGHNHNLLDIVRGAPKILLSDTTTTEITNSTDGFTSFNSDGFSLGANTLGTQSYELNKTGNNYVAWAWDAGSSNTTIAAGGLNSSSYDQSQNWTNLISFNAGGWNGNGINPFNDNATDYDYGDTTRANGGYATLDVSSLTGSRVISVTSEQTEVTITHAGGTTTFTPPNTGRLTHTFAAVSNPTSIKFDGLNGNSQFVLVGVTIDGKRLVNSNITPSNVPSIASTVRANPSAGFSIVSYNSGSSTGNYTLGHGLNSAPQFIIHKSRSTSNWWAYHESVIDNTSKYLWFNNTSAVQTNSAPMWGAALPTSSVFGIRVGDLIGTSQDAIAYCFAPVEGYSAMGSYTGNGSADGPLVYTGFRPSWILTKCSGSGEEWRIYDAVRDEFNSSDKVLVPNASGVEGVSSHKIDILSNGFKIRGTANVLNGNGLSYIYMAFAEHPFKTSRAR